MHVVLPRLGRLKLHESARKLARRLEAGTARILSATVRRDGGRWHVAFTVEVERTVGAPRARPRRSVSTSASNTWRCCPPARSSPNPRHLTAAQAPAARSLGRALARKQGPDRRTGQQPSKRWQQAAQPARPRARSGGEPAPRRAAQTHHPPGPRARHGRGRRPQRGRDARATGAWPGTSPTPGSPSSAGSWPTRPTGTAAASRGRPLVPVQQDLLRCGAVKTKLALCERTYECANCGLVLDRDLNAARNLAALAACRRQPPGVARWQDVEPTIRPADVGRWL